MSENAARDDKETEASLKTDELSLYTIPQSRVHRVNPEAGRVEQSVASVRTSAEPYMNWCREKTSYALDKAEEYCKIMEPGVNASKQTVRDTYRFLNNPLPEFYPCAGVVSFSAILGLYLARGGRVQRFLYPAGLMTLSASMFYPQHSASVVKAGKEQLFSWGSHGRVLWDEVRKRK